VIRRLVDQAFNSGKYYISAVGLSTDVKPTEGIITGSKFVEVDTGIGYLFDETAGEWHENQQLSAAVQAYFEDHPEAIDQAAIEAMFGERLDGIEEDIGGLKSALNADVEKEKEKIYSVFQYTDDSDWVEGYFWLSTGKTANATFNCYEPIAFLPGTYKIYGTLYSYSYIKIGLTMTKWSEYFGSDPVADQEFTLTEPVELCLSMNKNTNPKVRIIDKPTVAIDSADVPYTRGLIGGALNNSITVKTCKDFDDFAISYGADKQKQEEEIAAVFQYVDSSELNEGYFWLGKVKTANSTFNCYNPITFYPGEYHLIGELYSYSYVDSPSNGFLSWSDYFGSNKLANADFSLTETVDLYMSMNKNINSQIRIIDKNSFNISPASAPYTKGLVYGEVSEKIKIPPASVDTSSYDQAFIKNGELTCNNDHQNANTSVAKYTRANMGSNVSKIMCSGYFKEIGNFGNSITLIATHLDSYENVQNITRGSIHIGFGYDGMSVQIMIDNQLITIESFNYTSALSANEEGTFGWSLNGNTLTVYTPDGETHTVTDNRFADLNGQYMIFEHFRYLNSATDTPTDDFGQPVITGIYCECENGHPLRDNFKRADGAPNVSPTGHVYFQFRNACTGDTRFDNAGGSSN
jgi:hypothetical protein